MIADLFRRLTATKNPAVASGGVNSPEGQKKDEFSMLNIESKPRSGKPNGAIAAAVLASAPTRRPSAAELLDQWIAQGAVAPHSFIGQLTPELATLLLERNPENRAKKLSSESRGVPSYARDIEAGGWWLNGAAIVVSSCGLLNDGQNRCEAVLRSDRAIDTVFVFGVSRESRITLDRGAGRTPGDILEMNGYRKHSRNVATATQFLFAYCNELSMSATPSSGELLDIVRSFGPPEANDITMAVQAAARLAGDYELSKGYMGAVHLLCEGANPLLAAQFLNTVTTGTNIGSTRQPAAMLRAKYLKHAKGNELIHRLSSVEQAAFYIKAFNAHAAGRPISQLKLTQGGDRPESFPRVEG